ncbi:MAG: hypothetical protein GF416_01035 [Candidatus Altiarchaeales archaeon]|nr:hypothetical protein [Candidatus Altiarchaeales archaeon]MBD3415700.1 hypothetical protein [Candidatus Altiarchaeales archaeon]
MAENNGTNKLIMTLAVACALVIAAYMLGLLGTKAGEHQTTPTTLATVESTPTTVKSTPNTVRRPTPTQPGVTTTTQPAQPCLIEDKKVTVNSGEICAIRDGEVELDELELQEGSTLVISNVNLTVKKVTKAKSTKILYHPPYRVLGNIL